MWPAGRQSSWCLVASTFGLFRLPPGHDEPLGLHFWRFLLAGRTEIPGQARNEGEEGGPVPRCLHFWPFLLARRTEIPGQARKEGEGGTPCLVACTLGPFRLLPGDDVPRGKHFWRFLPARRTEIPGQARKEGVGPGMRGRRGDPCLAACTFGPFCWLPGRDEPRSTHFWRFLLAAGTR